MQIFKAFRFRRKYVWGIAAAVAVLAVGSHILPPAAEKAAAVLTAEAKRELPIYCVGTDEKKIAISFDAAWGADDTDRLLEILEENDVKATFFLCGYWVEKYPNEVKRIAEAGHTLGNHSATHPHMSQISSEQIAEELQKCHTAVKDVAGVDMDLFRPPFGEYTDSVIKTARENGYYSIQWDVDSLETKIKESVSWFICSPLFLSILIVHQCHFRLE